MPQIWGPIRALGNGLQASCLKVSKQYMCQGAELSCINILLHCKKYATERQVYVNNFSILPYFDNLLDVEQLLLGLLLTEKLVKLTASFIWECLEIMLVFSN